MTPERVEKLALKMMLAIQKEYASNPSLLTCRTLRVIAPPICPSQEEFDAAMRFIYDRKMVDVSNRTDGRAARINETGQAWLETKTEKWTLPNRLQLLSIVVALVGTVVALAIWYYGRFK